MNRYIAKQDMIVRTKSGKRVQIEAGKLYDGGYDFRNHPTNKSVLFVKVDGRKDEVEFPASVDFISSFTYRGHVDNVEYVSVNVVKRVRIQK